MRERPMGTRGSSLNSSSRDSVGDSEVVSGETTAVDEGDGVEEDGHILEPSRVVARGHHNSQVRGLMVEAKLSVFDAEVSDTWHGLVLHPNERRRSRSRFPAGSHRWPDCCWK